ncbi:hypothetical protein DPMN_098212 [Dreissena polymorpha]|uniref:Uncharacterized protein n=1 Tax=Dreissena polymorpha TaxID=45954 RepID=A0A9D4LE99_DREPO|nr:hypothetical protein DPMN_098212 [Dreissena polymorpha]
MSIFQKSVTDRQTDGQTDGQCDHYMPTFGGIIKSSNSVVVTNNFLEETIGDRINEPSNKESASTIRPQFEVLVVEEVAVVEVFVVVVVVVVVVVAAATTTAAVVVVVIVVLIVVDARHSSDILSPHDTTRDNHATIKI